MKNNFFIKEISAAIILMLLLFFLLDPFSYWMSDMLFMMLLAGLVVIFGIFVSFVWREKVRDEREVMLRLLAGRLSYLTGVAVLMIGVLVQSWQHDLDNWLVLSLAAMIVAKIIGSIYSRTKY